MAKTRIYNPTHFQRMETEAKDRMWQCRYCSAHYPEGFVQILVLHLQWHIERDPGQRPGQHRCPWAYGRKGPCGVEFSTPEGLAIHTLENHTRKRWCSMQKGKYRKAQMDSEEEKAQLLQEMGARADTPDRWFLPEHMWHANQGQG